MRDAARRRPRIRLRPRARLMRAVLVWSSTTALATAEVMREGEVMSIILRLRGPSHIGRSRRPRRPDPLGADAGRLSAVETGKATHHDHREPTARRSPRAG